MKITNIFADGSEIYLFKREDKKLNIQKVTNFHSYFYIDSENGEYTSLFGDKVEKLVKEHPSEVKKDRGNYEKTYEADIPFVNRYLIDRVSKIDETELRVHHLDIEVMSGSDNKMESPDNANAPIISITVYDNYSEFYYCFIWSPNIDVRNVYKIDNTFYKEGENKVDNLIIVKCESEQEMIRSFIGFEKSDTPDIWLAWNGEGYDYPYIFNRIKNLNLENEFKNISPIESCGYDGYRFYIAGIALLDLCDLYKKLSESRKESYSLDYIGKSELEIEKSEHLTWSEMQEIWKTNIDRFIKYNVNDVRIMVGVDKKKRIIDYFDSMRRIIKGTFYDVLISSKIVDNLLLVLSKDKFVLPTKVSSGDVERYKGATVIEPERGIHKWVINIDASAMYPSIIRSFNLSPEMISNSGVEINNLMFKQDKLGIISELINYLAEERKKIKDKLPLVDKNSEEYVSIDTQQKCFKSIVNSVYGQTGYKEFRLFCKEIAETTTFVGRELIKIANDTITENGYKVLYADTDGQYIESKVDNLEGAVEAGSMLQIKVNVAVEKWVTSFKVENQVSFKFEKIYKRMLLGAKKRYAGMLVWREGEEQDCKMDVVGFEVKRSDCPEIIRNFQKKILSLVLSDTIVEKDIEVFADEFLGNISKYKAEWGFPASISRSYKNIPIHIRASNFSNKWYSTDIGSGDHVKYYFVKKCNNPLIKEFSNVIAIKEGQEKILDDWEIDYDKVKERVLLKVNPILEQLGIIKYSSSDTKKAAVVSKKLLH